MKDPLPKTPLFASHSRSWRDNLYVYPVISRRSKGLSIGVNLNPNKICNFNCVYCCVDRTIEPTLKKVRLDRLAEELEHTLELAFSGEIFKSAPFDATPKELRRVNDIAFSGDGEPTAFADFPTACELAAKSLQRHRPASDDVRIVVITNATLLQRPKVARALKFLDSHNGELWAKLDAGSEAYFRRVDRTTIPLQRVLENILAAGKKRPIVIQSLFLKMHEQPPSATEIKAYLARLSALRDAGCQIKLVQVYTTARQTTEAYASPLDEEWLQSLAKRIEALALPAEAYGPTPTP